MDATAGSSSSNPYIVDDDDEEVYLLSDEKYAKQLQLKEALMFSSASSSKKMMKQPVVILDESNELPPERLCNICFDSKMDFQMFRNKNVCGHVYCSECIQRHVAEKIKMNIPKVTCPDPNCKAVIGPEVCRSILPKQVLGLWENALCESVILGSEKFYCSFKDCSAMLVNDGCVTVTSSECPYCHRLFCAQCKVVWHAGLDCGDFKRIANGEIERDDIMLMNLAKHKKWKRCPKCMVFVEKGHGCRLVTCRCGQTFCYMCGQRYCVCPRLQEGGSFKYIYF